MKNKYHIIFLCSLLISSTSFAQIASTVQGFDDIENLPGWEFSNKSVPLGDSNWFQGSNTGSIIVAQTGSAGAYIAANHRNTRGQPEISATICNFLIMPALGDLSNVSFYTRTIPASNNFNVFADRLYLVYSPTGGTNTGNCTDDFGDFTQTLLVVNPNLSSDLSDESSYPISYQQFSSAVQGDGRVAFVYFVEDAGFFGTNSNFIAVDTVEWELVPTSQ